MKKIIYIACLITLIVLSLCACSFSADTSVSPNTVHSVGVKSGVALEDIVFPSASEYPVFKPTGFYSKHNSIIDILEVELYLNNKFVTLLRVNLYDWVESQYSFTGTSFVVPNLGYYNSYIENNSSTPDFTFSSSITSYTASCDNYLFFINSSTYLYNRVDMTDKFYYFNIRNMYMHGNIKFTINFTSSHDFEPDAERLYAINFDYKNVNNETVRTTKNGRLGEVVGFTVPDVPHATFTGWDYPIELINRDITYTAQYTYTTFNIVLYDYSNKELSRVQRVAYSTLLLVQEPPDVLRLTFVGWSTEYFNKDKIINTSSHKVMSDMSLYATYSGGSVMPGPGQNNPLYKECEWFDFGQHLINFVGWLLFDMPIIKDVVSLINSLIAFLVSLFGFLGVFASMGFVGTLLIGVFGLFFLFKVIF